METLDKLLGVDPSETIATIDTPTAGTDLVPAPDVPANSTAQLEDDFQFARKGVREMITNTVRALDSAILLAQAGDSPRAYEVVGKMLEAMVTANRELVELHRTKKETLETAAGGPASLLPQNPSSVTIEKAVFIGRASDLLRELKQIEKQQAAAETAIDAVVVSTDDASKS
jgi:hypothetical protein